VANLAALHHPGRQAEASDCRLRRDAQRQEGHGRTSLRYKVKPKGGKWSAEKTFYHAGVKNSYPTLAEVAPGEFRCVWDSGTPTRSRTHIHFGKLKIAP